MHGPPPPAAPSPALPSEGTFKGIENIISGEPVYGSALMLLFITMARKQKTTSE